VTAASTSGSAPRPVGSSTGSMCVTHNDASDGSAISRRSRSSASPAKGVGAIRFSAPLRDLGLGLHQIERRNLTRLDANLVLPRELLRELERSLLNGDVRQVALSVQYACLTAATV
jgi:hypothetical protein